MDDLDDGRCDGQDMAEPQDARSGPGPASLETQLELIQLFLQLQL